MAEGKTRTARRTDRHRRIRKHISGTADRPRMAIMVSNKHMYVQFIDDAAAVTLASASTLKSDARPNLETAAALGKEAAKAAKAAGISSAVVDRGGFRYHGRVRALVEAAVAAGLKIGNTKVSVPAAAEETEPELAGKEAS